MIYMRGFDGNNLMVSTTAEALVWTALNAILWRRQAVGACQKRNRSQEPMTIKEIYTEQDIADLEAEELTIARNIHLQRIAEISDGAISDMPEDQISAAVEEIGVCFNNVRLIQRRLDKLSK